MYENVMKLTPDEIILMNGLVSVAKEAKEVAELIRTSFSNSFGIGVDRVEVWHDDYNHEYLTHDGVWQARYLHQTYDVKCTVEEIYNYFRAEYLVDNGFVGEFDGSRYTEAGRMKAICSYFRAFVQKLQK